MFLYSGISSGFDSLHASSWVSSVSTLVSSPPSSVDGFEQSVNLKTICCLLVGRLTSQQHATVSQGRICTGNFTCCHTEIEVAVQTFYLTRSQYTDTGPTSPSADPVMPGAWQGSHWSGNFEVTGMTRPGKKKSVSTGIRTPGLPLPRCTP